MKNYKSTLELIDESVDILKCEIYAFSHKGIKKSGNSARKVLSTLNKICKQTRLDILNDIKAMPISKRNITPETIERAKIKRKETLNKKNKHG